MDIQDQKYLEELAYNHKFTLDDLEANRKGSLSSKQKLGLFLSLILWLCLSVFSLIMLIQLILNIKENAFGVPLMLVFLLYVFWELLLAVRDFFSEKVMNISGAITPELVDSYKGNTRLQYHINNYDMTFLISYWRRLKFKKRLMKMIKPNQAYRVFYTKFGKKFLSLEPL